MTMYDKIAAIKKPFEGHWGNQQKLPYWGERVISQIGAAIELSKENGGEYDSLINQAVDYLYDIYSVQHAVRDDEYKKAEEMLSPLSAEAKKNTCYCVSHAHLDMDWLWGYHETVSIVTDTFRMMTELLDEYPDFKYSQSQAATYEITERYDPELFAKIKGFIAEGRWEFAGSTWVESDRNMPSSESLARQVLYTKRYLNEKLGIPYSEIKSDFHPDSFGHSPSMPEFFRQSGIKYFYHCRGLDGPFIYRFKAPSGAEVLTYNEPFWYNDEIRENELCKLHEFCHTYKVGGVMKVYGVGDHGGGPTRKDIENIIDMNSWPLSPNFRFSTYGEYFASIEPMRDTFTVLEEELGPTFTGCYTSESRIKQSNRIIENRLYQAEALTAMTAFTGKAKPYPLYAEAWKKALFNQFHDILPGSGITETRDHAIGYFEEALGYAGTGSVITLRDFAKNIDTSAFQTPDCPLLSCSEGGGAGCFIDEKSMYKLPTTERGRGKTRIIHLFNTTQYDRDDVSEIGIYDWSGDTSLMIVKAPDGSDIPFTVTVKAAGDNGHMRTTLLVKANVPAFGYSTLIISEKERTSFKFSDFTPDKRRTYYSKPVLENSLIRAEFDENTMKLVSLVDKESGRELLDRPSGYYTLAYENDKFIGANAWVEGIYTKRYVLNDEFRVFETGIDSGNQLRKKLTYKIAFNSSKLDVCVTLDEGSKTLRFNASSDWREVSENNGCPTLLFEVPFGYDTDKYEYDIQYGICTRLENSLHDSFGRDFIHAPSKDVSLALLTGTKYGYRGYDNKMTSTLLRATAGPDRYPEFGHRQATTAITVTDGTYDDLKKASLMLIHEMPYASNTAHEGTLPLTVKNLDVDTKTTVTALKTAEDGNGIILRIHNPSSQAHTSVIKTAAAIKTAFITDVNEAEMLEALKPDGCKIEIPLGKNSGTTVKIIF